MTKALPLAMILFALGCGTGVVTLPDNLGAARSTPGGDTSDPATTDPTQTTDPAANTDPSNNTAPEKTATLSWEAPTANADGSKPLSDLAGFKVYRKLGGAMYGAAIDVGNKTTYAFNNLEAGMHTFRVTAYDTSGNESVPTGEVSKTIQ